VVFIGILLSLLLIHTGVLTRLVEKRLAGVRHPLKRQVLITLGLANFMEGASVIAEPIIAPMLTTAGVAPAGAAALSIVGYAGLMSVEMAGIIITVLALVTNLPMEDLGLAAAWLSVPATVLMALCLPLFLPDPACAWRRLPWLVGCGLVAGLFSLAAAATLGVAIAGMVGGLAVTLLLLGRSPHTVPWDHQDLRDLLPFAFVLLPLLLVNAVPWLHDLTLRRLIWQVRVIPVHTITFTPFFSAYLYLLAALSAAILLLRVPWAEVRELSRAGASRGWRALLGMALFGAMGQIITYSGYSPDFAALHQPHNIAWVLAAGLKTYTAGCYTLFVPFLGWVGTFLTGYGVASLMLFGDLQVQAGALLQVSATWLAAGLAVGASIGSISSPFKIAIAAPMCGAEGQEGKILRVTIPLGIGASLLLGLILWAVL
jgi:lactate permease